MVEGKKENQVTPSIQSVPLRNLVMSTTGAQHERRKLFDKAAIGELAESIKTVGLLQPIVVRSLGRPDFFEIVAGERRYIAAKTAGLTEISCNVRELTDEQVLEVQLVENLQREGLHELVEAEGYEALIKLHKYTVEDLVAKVGKSRGYVYARLKLTALCKDARTAFHKGDLNASTALLIARIPNEGLQKSALGEITKLEGYGDNKAPMSARAAQKHIHENYMLRLSDAGFKTEDETLVPAAGACGRCPKRTGNQPQLFGDVKGADVCTDPICFRQKIAAYAERAIAAAAENGQKVIAGTAAKLLTKHGVDDYDLERSGYVRLDARNYAGKGTYRQTLGKAYVPTLLQDPESGKLIEVAPAKDVDKVNGNKSAGGVSRESQRQATERRNAERKHRAAIAYRVALFKAIHAASAKLKSLTRDDYNQIADRLFERLDHDSKKRLWSALGWEVKKKSYSLDFALPTPLPKMAFEDLLRFIRACSLSHELQVWQHGGESKPKDMEAAAATLGVDAAKIRRELDTAAKAKAKKAPAKKK